MDSRGGSQRRQAKVVKFREYGLLGSGAPGGLEEVPWTAWVLRVATNGVEQKSWNSCHEHLGLGTLGGLGT